MNYEFYKVIHLISILALFCSLGLLIAQAYYRSPEKDSVRKLAVAFHGTTLILILVTGFGMLAKLGIMKSLPTWTWMKVAAWIILGAYIVFIRKNPSRWALHLSVVLIFGAFAVYAVILKPGG